MSGEPRGRRNQALVINCELRGKNRVEFLDHAVEKMAERGVSAEQIIEAIRTPDQTGLPVDQPSHPDAPVRDRVRKILNDEWAVDVVYEDLPDCIRVVTTYFRKKRPSGRW